MDCSVMTFNLRYHNPGDGGNAWPHRYDQVVALLQSCDPIVIGTQEGLYPMLLELSAGLPEYGWIGQGRYGGRDDEHNAIFYKKNELELVSHGQFWLSEQPDRPGSISWESSLPRICVWAHLRSIRDPQTQFKVFNTHLDHISGRAQEEGMKVVMQAMREHYRKEPLPMLLMGDFNSYPNDPAVRLIRTQATLPGGLKLCDCFTLLSKEPGATFHGFQGGEHGEPIDYIFASGEIRLREIAVIRDRGANGRFPSDHYPVMARISL